MIEQIQLAAAGLVAFLAAGFVNLLMFPLLVRVIGRRMDAYDERRELAMAERESQHEESRLWREAITAGMRSLLRSELVSEHRKWTKAGHCPLETKEYLTRCHRAYANLGGNDIGDRLFEQTMALPVKKEEE